MLKFLQDILSWEEISTTWNRKEISFKTKTRVNNSQLHPTLKATLFRKATNYSPVTLQTFLHTTHRSEPLWDNQARYTARVYYTVLALKKGEEHILDARIMTSKNHDVLQKDEISRRWQRLLSNTRSASNLLLATGLMSLGEEGLFWQQGVSLSSETR